MKQVLIITRESKFRPQLREVFHGLMMGTAEGLSGKDNIGVMAFMENKNIELARAKGFKNVFATNTSPLTQQIGESVFGYETITEVQVNKYIDHNGNRPFANAPDSQMAVVMLKSLE